MKRYGSPSIGLGERHGGDQAHADLQLRIDVTSSHCQLPLHFLAAVSLERDFCRRRRPRQKGLEDGVSAQRPEIGDQRAREMAATAFLFASYLPRVSEDWVVGAPGLEPGTR